jgi:hypothetical protein
MINMKKICCLSGLLFFLTYSVLSQGILVFKGTVKCFNSDDDRSTRGAKNVVIVPGFIPKKSGMTGDLGYYEINTGVPIRKFEDKYVVIYYVSSCKQCEKKESIFVSSVQARDNRAQTLSYITIPTIKMNAGCKSTELDALKADLTINGFISQPGEDLDKVSALNVVTAPPGLLNLLTNVVSIPANVVGAANITVDTAARFPGKIDGYGKFLLASPMTLTTNTGFNFAPFRDRSEAVFWNPAALANSPKASALNLFMNIKNNYKLSGSTRINDNITIGLGGIYTKQDQYRTTRYPDADPQLVQHLENLEEYAFFLASAIKLSSRLSAGLTIKSVWQNFNIPNLLDGTTKPNVFTDSMIRRQRFDADLSVSYDITPALNAGINIMNIAGAELYADAFAAGQTKIPFTRLRSVGIGLCYKWRQFNFGTDALFARNGLHDVSAGINYVPFNNALLAAGWAFRQKSYSASFKWKQFRIGYVNDNGLMVDGKKPGKSAIVSGRIYSGVGLNF